MQVEQRSLCILPYLWPQCLWSGSHCVLFPHSYLHGKIHATCTSEISTRVSSSVQMHFTSFELLIRSGGVFKQSWQSFHIYLDNNMYNRFCFLSQKLFVQIWLCVSAQAQTIAPIHAGLGVVYILPDLFICGVVPTLEMPVY